MSASESDALVAYVRVVVDEVQSEVVRALGRGEHHQALPELARELLHKARHYLPLMEAADCDLGLQRETLSLVETLGPLVVEDRPALRLVG
jgi:hypothetical protein